MKYNKHSFLVLFFISNFLFCQEKPFFKDLFHGVEFNFDFSEVNTTKAFEKSNGFDFESFIPNMKKNSDDSYYKIYKEAKEIKSIVKYSKEGSYSDNYTILINKSTPDYIIYTICYFSSISHNTVEGMVSPGVYVFDRARSTNYFIEISNYEPSVFVNEDEEILLESIRIVDDFSTNFITRIYLLDTNLTPISSINWYHNGIEMERNFSSTGDVDFLLETNFYTKYRCKKEIFLNEITTKMLCSYFENGIPCNISYSFIEKRKAVNKKPVWFWL